MPDSASSYAAEVDWVFYFILGVSVFMFFLIAILMMVFIWRYRHREGHVAQKTSSHSTALELTWTIVPTLIVMLIFYFGFRSFMNVYTSPGSAYEINVVASKWNWSFVYPNGYVDNVLHVPKGRPVRLILTSQDVIHSLFIPAFRVKRDCVPGRYNKMWFEATKTGEFPLLCAEYCGTAHSEMLSTVVVHEPTVFQKWLEESSNWVESMPPTEAGKKLLTKRGCVQCHTTDGAPAIGPTLKNVFGSKQVLANGEQIVADENYIRDSILNPGAHIVAGFENVMPTYQGRIKDQEITAVIEYLKSISDSYQADKQEEAKPESE